MLQVIVQLGFGRNNSVVSTPGSQFSGYRVFATSVGWLTLHRMGPVTIVFSVLLVMTLAHGEFLMKSHLWDKHPDCIRVIDFTVDSVLWVGYAIVLLLLGATDLASLYSQTCVEQQCYMGMTRFGAPQGTHRAGYVVSGHVNWKSNVYSP